MAYIYIYMYTVIHKQPRSIFLQTQGFAKKVLGKVLCDSGVAGLGHEVILYIF